MKEKIAKYHFFENKSVYLMILKEADGKLYGLNTAMRKLNPLWAFTPISGFTTAYYFDEENSKLKFLKTIKSSEDIRDILNEHFPDYIL